MRRFRHLGIINDIQGMGPGGDYFWIRFMGPVRSDVMEGVRDAHRVTTTDHGESGKAEPRKDLCDTIGGGSSGGIGDVVG